MLNKMIHWALASRALIIGAALILMVMGLKTATELPVEVLPDLTKPTVIILTESPGLAPEEVETRVTQPIETALMGVAGLTRLRSNSDVALSLVYAEFGWDMDIYKARMLVQERLQGVREQLPEGVQPFMTPVASLMGEILLVGVRSTIKEGEPGYLPPREVRSLADWTIMRRLKSVPGIAEILAAMMPQNIFAAAAARLAGKGFEFISIGSQSMKPSYLAQASQFISMQGHLTQTKVREQMMRADVLVFPTLSDGFGLVQLEAMAAGLTVIATGCCGEVVRHGHDGLIVPPRDSGAVVAALDELRTDPDKHERFSAAASRRPSDYSPERHFGALLSL